ncbi:molecular chaperone TorD family protein [Nonomuraea muscovyensis]|uniref:TorD/DmsD family molecular chaperone n=1 Tax=Nonomuraea muscovyensis TaxID=1124761 RepID=UPI00340E755E|nr:Nitrate reductase delta subunit [Nonomuraea muscovyensis]
MSDVLLLASRLLSREIDGPLYRALLAAPDGDRLLDAQTRALGEPEALRSLSVEFCRLFVGPRPACPPYESVHRGEPVVGGRAERRLQDFMERHRLDAVIPSGCPVLAYDHLAVSLALLHHLLGVAADGAARQLLQDHLLAWAPAYFRGLKAAAVLPPYTLIADLLAEYLA